MSPKEVKLLKPQNNYYRDLAMNCAKKNISVDLFSLPSSYVDLASIGMLSHFTGGQVNYYMHFKAQTHGVKLSHDLQTVLLRETGFDGVLRVRCSTGVGIKRYYGNQVLRAADLMGLSTVDCDKSFVAEAEILDKLRPGSNAYFQAALLYTMNGEKRIRVLTISTPVTHDARYIYENLNPGVAINVIGKMSISKVLNSNLVEAKKAIFNIISVILAGYYRVCQGIFLLILDQWNFYWRRT